jgi:uncharacterized protein (TIGR03000 family)
MSKWGHPAFTIGLTPYDSINTGHGNYPGGPGFIPGYGYYPGMGPEHYPWLDGPGTPFDRRKLAVSIPPAAFVEDPPPPDVALIVVKLPAEAELWFNGAATSQSGSYRRFVTPALSGPGPFKYTLRVRWRLGTVELSRVEEIHIQPGATATVNLLTTEGWTGYERSAQR